MKHCIVGQKFNVNVIKIAHRRSNFSKTHVSQETFTSTGLRSKSVIKISRISVLENVICIFVKNLGNVGKKLEIKLQYIDI